MEDVRPDYYIRAEVLRKFRKKGTNEYILSKKPNFIITGECSDGCRETLASGVKEEISYGRQNEIARSNPYKLEYFIKKYDGRDIVFNRSFMEMFIDADFRSALAIRARNKKEEIKETIFIIMGLLQNILVKDSLLEWYQHTDDFVTAEEIDNGGYSFKVVLTPYYIANTVIFSLITGLARESISIPLNNGDLIKYLDNEFGINYVYDMIREDNKTRCWRIWQSIAEYLRSLNLKGLLISNYSIYDFIELLYNHFQIYEGYDLGYFWVNAVSCFGINSYLDYYVVDKENYQRLLDNPSLANWDEYYDEAEEYDDDEYA